MTRYEAACIELENYLNNYFDDSGKTKVWNAMIDFFNGNETWENTMNFVDKIPKKLE